MEDLSNAYRDNLDKRSDPVVVGAGTGSGLRIMDECPVYEADPQQEGEWGDSGRIRYGNNRYHTPKAKARAKQKARKQAQKAARRR